MVICAVRWIEKFVFMDRMYVLKVRLTLRTKGFTLHFLLAVTNSKCKYGSAIFNHPLICNTFYKGSDSCISVHSHHARP